MNTDVTRLERLKQIEAPKLNGYHTMLNSKGKPESRLYNMSQNQLNLGKVPMI